MRKELVIIYPGRSLNISLDADFSALNVYLKSAQIPTRLIPVDPSSKQHCFLKEFSREIECINLVYFHVTNIEYIETIIHAYSSVKTRSTILIAGGITALSNLASDVLACYPSIDIVIRGPENEKVLALTVNSIWQNKDWSSIRGITFKDKKYNKIRYTKNVPLSENLDYLGTCKCENISQTSNKYWYPVITSRGCSYNCQYCGYQIPYRKDYKLRKTFWRTRSEKSIVDEIEWCLLNGKKRFVFHCNQFLNPLSNESEIGSAVKIAKEILHRKIDIEFRFSSKAPEIKTNMEGLFILREAGMKEIDVGIDSGSDRFHKIYDTGSSVNDNLDALKALAENRFNFDISFIFFEPYLDTNGLYDNILFLNTIDGYLAHLDRPYSWFLDSRILRSVLVLRWGMPILDKLKKDKLLGKELPLFKGHPVASFKCKKISVVYSVYSALEKTILPLIRPLFQDKTLVTEYDFINLFLLKLIRKIYDDTLEQRFKEFFEYLSSAEDYIREVFIPVIGEILTSYPNYQNHKLEKWIKSPIFRRN